MSAPDFPIEHENDDGWSDWIHPLPGYQMKCCNCGLVHSMEFRLDDAGQINFRASRTHANANSQETAEGQARNAEWQLNEWMASGNIVVNQVWDLLGGPDATREGGQSLVTRVMEVTAQLSQALARIEELEKALEWRSMESAPKDGSQFVGIELWPDKTYARIYRWVGAPNFWVVVNGDTYIRPEYQQRYLWRALPATPIAGGDGQ